MFTTSGQKVISIGNQAVYAGFTRWYKGVPGTARARDAIRLLEVIEKKDLITRLGDDKTMGVKAQCPLNKVITNQIALWFEQWPCKMQAVFAKAFSPAMIAGSHLKA